MCFRIPVNSPPGHPRAPAPNSTESLGGSLQLALCHLIKGIFRLTDSTAASSGLEWVWRWVAHTHTHISVLEGFCFRAGREGGWARFDGVGDGATTIAEYNELLCSVVFVVAECAYTHARTHRQTDRLSVATVDRRCSTERKRKTFAVARALLKHAKCRSFFGAPPGRCS